jgi:hypothetical protein
MPPLDPSPCSLLLPSSSGQVVANPSALFLSDRNLAPTVSSAVAVVLEGTRPMLMEVQALCSSVPKDSGQPPMRMPSGVNRQRLALLLAVLGKHTDMRPYSVDVHLNVTGGEPPPASCFCRHLCRIELACHLFGARAPLSVLPACCIAACPCPPYKPFNLGFPGPVAAAGLEMNEPATDLAVACAIASSYYEQPIARDVAMIGEVRGAHRALHPAVAALQSGA